MRFELGPRRGDNAVRCAGQAIGLDPRGQAVNRLYLLAAASGELDIDNVAFRLNGRTERKTVPSITAHVGRGYDDGQRVRDDKPIWHTPVDPYVKYTPVAWYATHLSLKDAASERRKKHPSWYPYPPESESGRYDCDSYGSRVSDILPYEFGYMFQLRCDLKGGGPWTLNLPRDQRVLVFAVTLARNEDDDTSAAGRLYE